MNPTPPSAHSGPPEGWTGGPDEPVRVRVPADLDTPDRIAFGLTLRQIIVIAAFAAPLYLAWQALLTRVPLPVLAAGSAPLAALALAIAVGRRDGLPLDAWLAAALTHGRRPRRLSPSGRADRDPSSPRATGRGPRRMIGQVGALLLPVTAVADDGVLTTTSGHGGARSAAVLVAVRTVTAGLHTPGEQAALLAGAARWLNGLSAPVQVLLSSRPVDLAARAQRIGEHAQGAAHPALARAALEHAQHLLHLGGQIHPRARTVTIVCTTAGSPGNLTPGGRARTGGEGAGRAADVEARRRAEQSAAALAGLGAQCRILDGPEATAVLAAACDPSGGTGLWRRTPPGTTVTGPAPGLSPEPATGADPVRERMPGWSR